MGNILSPLPRQRYFDANGVPLAGGLLYSYIAGTATPLVTYANQAGTTNANPVVLDANGYADVWIDITKTYKFALYDSGSNLLWTTDNINTPVTSSANLVYAGPVSGAAATPTFRALGNTDLPLTVVTKTANYTALITDQLILCNTNAFTVTLPAASTYTGPPLQIEKIGSDTNAITIARASSDTIQGSTSTTLNTQYEGVTLASDGVSTWYILRREYPRGFIAYTPTIAGCGTVSAIVANYSREGSYCHVNLSAISGVTSSTDISFTLPTSLAIDTTFFTQTTPVVLLGTFIASAGSNVLIFGGATPQGGVIFFDGSDTAKVYVGSNSNTGIVKAPGSSLVSATYPIIADFRVPISGWK